MRKFEVGDRIACYIGSRVVGTVKLLGMGCNQLLFTYPQNPEGVWVHLKQCRRLKPKKARRRIWIPMQDAERIRAGEGRGLLVKASACEWEPSDIEFIEVRRKK